MNFIQYPGEACAEIRERVFDARRYLGVAAFLQDAEVHQLAQPFVQHLGGQAVRATLHLSRTADAAPHHVYHRQRPFAADYVLDHVGCRGACIRRGILYFF